MYKALKKLIENCFYSSKEEAINKINLFFDKKKLKEEEYKELLNLLSVFYK